MRQLDLATLQSIAMTCPFGVMVVDSDHKIVAINYHGAAILEYLPEEMVGTDLNDYVLKNADHQTAAIAFTKGNSGVARSFEHTTTYGISKSGGHIRVSIKIQHLSNGLAYAAFHDPAECTTGDSLTNALTRDQFFIALNQIRSPYSLLFIDLNKFKAVNDELGHIAGDEVLRAVSKRLKNVLRETDLFCRYGGDEFIIVVPGNGATAAAVSKKVQALVSQPVTTRTDVVNISCSIGIASSTEATDVDELIHIADQRMYAEKT